MKELESDADIFEAFDGCEAMAFVARHAELDLVLSIYPSRTWTGLRWESFANVAARGDSAWPATKVAPGAHAILILDHAGWHGAKELRILTNISLLPLPPRSAELNSQASPDATGSRRSLIVRIGHSL